MAYARLVSVRDVVRARFADGHLLINQVILKSVASADDVRVQAAAGEFGIDDENEPAAGNFPDEDEEELPTFPDEDELPGAATYGEDGEDDDMFGLGGGKEVEKAFL